MKSWLKQFTTEDWIIVFVGAAVLALACIFPASMPKMPKTLASGADWLSAIYMFGFVLLLTYVTLAALRKPLKGTFVSLLFIFAITLLAQVTANIPIIKTWGLESVFFAVIYGLILNNCFKLPSWLKTAVNSEFYIKVGIICLGSTILFGEMMKSGAFGLAQSLIVVFTRSIGCNRHLRSHQGRRQETYLRGFPRAHNCHSYDVPAALARRTHEPPS